MHVLNLQLPNITIANNKGKKMLKTCYQPKFDHSVSMWRVDLIYDNRTQITYCKTLEDAVMFRIRVISKQYKGGILAHDNQFKVR